MAVGGMFLDRPGAPPLFVRRVGPAAGHPPRAHLLLVHASMVHSEYYLPLASELASADIDVWVPDLRGHGRSGGIPGHLGHWRQHVADVADAFAAMCRGSTVGAPLLLAGESYGGLMVYLACQSRLVDPAATLLLSPALGLTLQVSARQRWWLRHVGRPLLSRMRPVRPLGHAGIAADPYIGRLIDADRQTSRHYTLGFLAALLEAVEAAHTAPPRAAPPILALLSAGDPVCDNAAAERLLRRHPAAIVKVLSGPQHSLVADLPEAVATEMLAWVRRWAPGPVRAQVRS